MSWFRKKNKYWYFVERKDGKEVQHYIGDDEAVKNKLLPNPNNGDTKQPEKKKKVIPSVVSVRPCPAADLDLRATKEQKRPNKHITKVTASIERDRKFGGFGLIYNMSNTGFGECGSSGGGRPGKPGQTYEDVKKELINLVKSSQEWHHPSKRNYEFRTTIKIDGHKKEIIRFTNISGKLINDESLHTLKRM